MTENYKLLVSKSIEIPLLKRDYFKQATSSNSIFFKKRKSLDEKVVLRENMTEKIQR